VLSGDTLYGAAQFGGSSGNGAVFALNTDGTNFRNLHSFTLLYFNGIIGTNADGTYPYGTLILSSNTLYGTALFGGNAGDGTVFALNTDGTGFTTLHSFTPLVRSLPQLKLTRSRDYFVLRWPLAVPGTPMFTLQSSYDLSSASGWRYFTYTSSIAGQENVAAVDGGDSHRFFRLVPVSGLGGGCAGNKDCASGSMCVYGTCMTIIGGGGGCLGFGFGGQCCGGICAGCGG